MKLFAFLFLVLSAIQVQAQKRCSSSEYLAQALASDAALKSRMNEIEMFAMQVAGKSAANQRTQFTTQVIKIPVVFHVLYNSPDENVRTERIIEQMNALNRDFRRKNADTVNTPQAFTAFAADMEIEFQLAKRDPAGRSTEGIVRKYTPVKYWMSDDKMKFNSTYGDNAWDSKSYLNIWVCNLKGELGYSALPGSDLLKDGIVLNYSAIGGNGSSNTNKGRTLVHEAGHWLSLKHIWGDSYCGDDHIEDTPEQSTYTPGCPSGIRRTCGNNDAGDMYMNYMDFTNDGCMNLFTKGQKQKARALFEPGGYRNSILNTTAFNTPTIYAASLPDFYPRWKEAQVYPNPATNNLNIYLEYDERWIGKEIQVIDMTGKIMFRKTITSTIQQIDVNRLARGMYFIRAEKEDEKIQGKFIKL
jgi:hypothetical protein